MTNVDENKRALRLDLQRFAEGDPAGEPGATGDQVNTAAGLDDLLGSMPGASEPPATPPATPPAGEETPPAATPPADNQPSAADKQAFAFGQMRKENADLTALLGKMAQASGIEFKDQKELREKLSDVTIEQMAKKDNVPVALYKELEELRAITSGIQQQTIKEEASVGFQKIMTEHGLTQDELKSFALELDQKGMNPFESKMDVEALYRDMHFNDIMQKRIAVAVQEALSKNNAADTSSSTPNQQQGAGSGASETKISTFDALDALLAQKIN